MDQMWLGSLVDNISSLFHSSATDRLLQTLVVVAVGWVMYRIVLSLVFRRVEQPLLRIMWRQTVSYMFLFVGFVVSIKIWIEDSASIVTILSLIAAALTISMKEIILSIAGWVVILWRGLFVIGDRIVVHESAGDVIGTGVLYFTMAEVDVVNHRQILTGRIIKVPNSTVLNYSVFNYTHNNPYIWHEVSARIKVSSNWKAAEEIMQRHVNYLHREVAAKYDKMAAEPEKHLLLHGARPGTAIRVDGEVVVLAGRFLTNVTELSSVEDTFWRNFLADCAADESITLSA